MANDGTPLPSALSGTMIQRPIHLDTALFYLVTGQLIELLNREKFEQTGTLTVEDAKDAINQMVTEYFTEIEPPVTVMYPDNFLITAEQGLNPGLNYNIAAASAQLYAHQGEVTPIADANSYIFPFFCRAGTYDLKIRGLRGTNFGNVDWYVDSDLQVTGTIWYNGTAQNNFLQTIEIEVLTDGNHHLVGVVNGKQAASSSYRFVFISAAGYVNA